MTWKAVLRVVPKRARGCPLFFTPEKSLRPGSGSLCIASIASAGTMLRFFFCSVTFMMLYFLAPRAAGSLVPSAISTLCGGAFAMLLCRLEASRRPLHASVCVSLRTCPYAKGCLHVYLPAAREEHLPVGSRSSRGSRHHQQSRDFGLIGGGRRSGPLAGFASTAFMCYTPAPQPTVPFASDGQRGHPRGQIPLIAGGGGGSLHTHFSRQIPSPWRALGKAPWARTSRRTLRESYSTRARVGGLRTLTTTPMMTTQTQLS